MEEKTKYYDQLVQATLLNIYSCSKKNKTIVLTNFDRKSKDHRLVLEVALVARDIFGFPIYVKSGLMNTIWVNLHLHKNQKRVLNNSPKDFDVTDVVKLINFEQCICDEGSITFEEVYKAYYERKKRNG